jgi:hypothetical protein
MQQPFSFAKYVISNEELHPWAVHGEFAGTEGRVFSEQFDCTLPVFIPLIPLPGLYLPSWASVTVPFGAKVPRDCDT